MVAVSANCERADGTGWLWGIDVTAWYFKFGDDVQDVSCRTASAQRRHISMICLSPVVAVLGLTENFPSQASPKQWLEQSQSGIQSLLDVYILGLNILLLSQSKLKLLVWLLVAQVVNLPLQRLNLRLCPFSYRPLRFSIVRPLLCQLLGGEIGDTAGCSARSSTSFGSDIKIGVVIDAGGRGR